MFLLTIWRMQGPEHFLFRSFLRVVLTASDLGGWDNAFFQYQGLTFLTLTVKRWVPPGLVSVCSRFGTSILWKVLSNNKEWTVTDTACCLCTTHMGLSASLLWDLRNHGNQCQYFACASCWVIQSLVSDLGVSCLLPATLDLYLVTL